MNIGSDRGGAVKNFKKAVSDEKQEESDKSEKAGD